MGQLGVSGEDLERLGAPKVVIFKGMGSFKMVHPIHSRAIDCPTSLHGVWH